MPERDSVAASATAMKIAAAVSHTVRASGIARIRARQLPMNPERWCVVARAFT